jgi:hypothetical protein
MKVTEPASEMAKVADFGDDCKSVHVSATIADPYLIRPTVFVAN